MDTTLVQPVSASAGAFDSDDVGVFDLDVRIVEVGDAVNALLCTTDNGCDTRKDGDC